MQCIFCRYKSYVQIVRIVGSHTPSNNAMAKQGPYHKGHVKEDLLEAAEKLLDESGLDAISVRKLCSIVGVTPGNFYNHYDNLDDLLAHLCVRFFTEYRARIDEVRARHRRPLLRLKAAAREFVRFAMENPAHYRLLYGSSVSSLLMKHELFTKASEEAFRKTVIEIYGEDVYRTEDRPWSQRNLPHAYAYFALLNGLARDVIDGLVEFESDDDIDPFIERIMDSLFGGKLSAELGHRL